MTEQDEELMRQSIVEYKRERYAAARKPPRREQKLTITYQLPPERRTLKGRAAVKRATGPDRIVCELVEKEYGIAAGSLLSRSQNQKLVYARAVVATILRRVAGYSLPRIGALFSRHHTTIMYAIDSVCTRCGKNAIEKQRVIRLMDAVQGMDIFPVVIASQLDQQFQRVSA